MDKLNPQRADHLDNHNQDRSEQATTSHLSPLAPSTVLPEAYSRHMQRLAQLKRIQDLNILVETRGDKHCYVIAIHRPPHLQTNTPAVLTSAVSNLPTSVESGSYSNFFVKRIFSDFVRLRDDLYNCSLTSHPVERCGFCNDIVKHLRLKPLQLSSPLLPILPKEKRARALNEFLKGLLRLAVLSPTNVSQTCHCQEQVPKQLHKFLLES